MPRNIEVVDEEESSADHSSPKKVKGLGVPVSDVTVIVGYHDKDGKRQEVVHDIADVTIVSCEHKMDRKYKAMKDDHGEPAGYEPTGECTLTLRVRYIQE